jgi:hypothetical protein
MSVLKALTDIITNIPACLFELVEILAIMTVSTLISLSIISIKTNFKQIIRFKLKFVQYSQGDYILCMTSRYFFPFFHQCQVTVFCLTFQLTLTLTLTSSSFYTQRIWNCPLLSFTPVPGKEQVLCLIRRTISGHHIPLYRVHLS